MQYIATKRFKRKGIGGHMNIRYGSVIEKHDDGILYYQDKPICVFSSLAAHQHFARNDDGQGIRRGKLTYKMAFSPRGREDDDGHIYRFSKDERDMLIGDYRQYLKQAEPLLFNQAFFDAEIPVLEEMAAKLHITVKE